METIIIFLMVCGHVDTILIKEPDTNPVYYIEFTENIINKVDNIMSNKPILMVYNDKRDICA